MRPMRSARLIASNGECMHYFICLLAPMATGAGKILATAPKPKARNRKVTALTQPANVRLAYPPQ
jgi:hypothetical protein